MKYPLFLFLFLLLFSALAIAELPLFNALATPAANRQSAKNLFVQNYIFSGMSCGTAGESAGASYLQQINYRISPDLQFNFFWGYDASYLGRDSALLYDRKPVDLLKGLSLQYKKNNTSLYLKYGRDERDYQYSLFSAPSFSLSAPLLPSCDFLSAVFTSSFFNDQLTVMAQIACPLNLRDRLSRP